MTKEIKGPFLNQSFQVESLTQTCQTIQLHKGIVGVIFYSKFPVFMEGDQKG